MDSQDVYNLKTIYVEGVKVPLAHIHWRRFALSSIPFQDTQAFDQWLYDRWAEKDQLLKHHQEHGGFPSSEAPIRTKVALWNVLEVIQLLVSVFPVITLWSVSRFGWKVIASLIGL